MSIDKLGDFVAEQVQSVNIERVDGKFTIPDASLLFGADFQRDGPDLLLLNEGASALRIPDYFLIQPPAPIHAPNGTSLIGEVVDRLAGPNAPAQYAQIGGQRGADPIGQVETVENEARVERSDGTAQTLEVGMKIYQNDVIETVGDSTVAITFVDGTIFSLSENSRMIIDELIFSSEGDNNSATFELIQGGFVFIAGQVAKTGSMEVNTPSATMGIRGTTGWISVYTQNGEDVSEFLLTTNADGETSGMYDLSDRITGEYIATVDIPGTLWTITTDTDGTTATEILLEDLNPEVAQALVSAFSALESRDERGLLGEPAVPLDSDNLTEEGPEEGPGAPSDPVEIDPNNEQFIPPDQNQFELENRDSRGLEPEDINFNAPSLEAGDVLVEGPEDPDVESGISGVIDFSSEGGAVVFTVTRQPFYGDVSLENDGFFRYVPEVNFNGRDSFDFTVTNDAGVTDTGTVIVDVSPVNDAPQLVDLAAFAAEDSILTGLLDGTDVDGDSLTYSIFSEPSNGTVVVNPDGSYGYLSDTNYFGTDSFQVLVSDVNGATDTATITVSIAAANDVLVIRPSTLTGDVTEIADGTPGEATNTLSASGAVNFSDVDVTDTHTATFAASSTGYLGTFSIVQPNSTNMTADGAVAWTFSIDDADIDELSEGEQLIQSYNVTIDDGNGGTVSETIIITITGTDDAALVTGVVTGAVTEGDVGDAPETATGTLVISDVDGDDAPVFADVVSTAGENNYGTFTLTAGTWVYTLDQATVQALDADEEVEDFITFTASDGTEQVVTITITGVDGALVAVDDADSFSEDDVAGGATVDGSINVLTNDSDPDATDLPLLVQAASVDAVAVSDGATLGTIVFAANGTYTLALNVAGQAAAEALDDSETLEVAADYTVVNQDGAEETATLTITITGTNDAPTIGGDITGAVFEDAEESSISGTLTASDPDTGDNVEWSVQGTGTGVYGLFSVDDATGEWTYRLNNRLADPLLIGETVTETFIVSATDLAGDTTEQLVQITVTGANDLPVLVFNPVIEIESETVLASSLTAIDPEGEAVTFSVVPGSGAQNGSLSLNGNGSYTYTPDAGFVGFDSFDYTATDASGGVSIGTVTIAVESPDGGGSDPVTITINTSPGDSPASSVTLDAEEVTELQINAIFAIDGSGSISEADWALTRTNLLEAARSLQSTYSGSLTQVTIGFTVFSTFATDVTSFDLNDTAGWESYLSGLSQPGGLTNWGAGLNSIEQFLDGPSDGGPGLGIDASNFVFFLTDGIPTFSTTAWQTARASLIDEAANGYSVSIDAFGIGDVFDANNTTALQNLQDLDTDPVPPPPDTNFTLLSDPSELAAALTADPVFNPVLIDFNVRLSVDGAAAVDIADETSPALLRSGIDYELAFSEIDGLAADLSLSNRFSVTATYDLDGDGIADITLFETEDLGRAETAQTLSGSAMDGSDLLFGSDFDDSITGLGGDDILVGYAGDDMLSGGAGADTVLAGEGNDLLVLDGSDLTGDVLDGGAGQDYLVFDGAGGIDLSALDGAIVTNVEGVDMTNGEPDQLSLSYAEVVDLLSTTDALLEDLLGETLTNSAIILGDSGGIDMLTLEDGADGTWNQRATPFVDDGDGNTLAIFDYVPTGGGVLATIGVDEDLLPVPVTA